MNILVLNWQDITNPLGGGAEVHLHEIFKRVAAQGHGVTLYCSGFDGAPSTAYIDGIRIIREGSRNTFNFRVPFAWLGRFRHEHFDIVIDDINKIPFYTPLYVKQPLIGISHHFFGKGIFREVGPIAGSYVFAAEKMVDVVYKNTPMVVVSQSTLDEFMERGFDPSHFTIVPNCIDQLAYPFTVSAKNSYPTVAYFGRIKKYKSVDHVLYAFATILAAMPDAQLHIIGKGDYLPALKELAGKLGIDTATTFFGYVDDATKNRLLGAAHCVVNSSIKEGWGIINIEANACGTPVISANVPGLKDSVRDGVSGLLYEYGKLDELAQKISRVLTDEDLRQRLSHGAVEWARQFDWANSAKTMIDLCERVIARAAAQRH